jgi:16S rRNA (cytosine967-C5)-methyltransferase
VAAEPSLRRLEILRRRVAQWGAPNVRCVAANGLTPPFQAATFDTVLVDAPCTGLGTLARHPDIRWRLRPEDVDRHARRQRDLLACSAGLVRPEGRLVYSTCSLEPEETDHILSDFTRRAPEFTRAPYPDWTSPFGGDGPLRLLPERDGGDGFFAAVLRRD